MSTLLDGVVILCFIDWFLTVYVQCNRTSGTQEAAAKVKRERGESERDPISPALIGLCLSGHVVSTPYSLNP